MCAHPLSSQTIEKMVCKELEFPQEPPSSGEEQTRGLQQPERFLTVLKTY